MLNGESCHNFSEFALQFTREAIKIKSISYNSFSRIVMLALPFTTWSANLGNKMKIFEVIKHLTTTFLKHTVGAFYAAWYFSVSPPTLSTSVKNNFLPNTPFYLRFNI